MPVDVPSASDGSHPAVALYLDSRPQTVTLVRAALSALAERLDIDAELLDDLRTSISEACNNVVMHAYPDRDAGSLIFALYISDEAVTAVVRDQGVGLDPHALGSASGLDLPGGVGIPVIRALSSEARFERPEGGGTEVRMVFSAHRNGRALLAGAAPAAELGATAPAAAYDVSGSVSPITLLPPVLGRLARTLAAAAQFSLDRFSDVYLVTDAVGALLGSDAAAERVAFELRGRDRRLELRLGPLKHGCTERVRTQNGEGVRPSPLVSLTDSLQAEDADDGTERLLAVLIDHREE